MISSLSIKTKLISVVSLLMVAIIVTIAYLTISYFESQTKELIAAEQFAKVSLFAGEIDDKLGNAHDLLIVLAKGRWNSVYQAFSGALEAGLSSC